MSTFLSLRNCISNASHLLTSSTVNGNVTRLEAKQTDHYQYF